MSKKVKLGIIGAGNMATNIHMPSIAELDNCEVVAICDLFEDKAKALAAKYGVKKTYALHPEMLKSEEMDAVVVLVNPDRTYWVANDCLRAGFHVLMEKPAGMNAFQAHSLARTAEKMGKIAAVAMNRRHIPLIQEVLKRFEGQTITQVDGRFMKFSHIEEDWHYMSAYMADIIHCTDLIRYLAGSEPADAATVIGNFHSPVDNAWSSVIRFENGVTGTLRSNYQAAARFHDVEIHSPTVSAYINLGMGDLECNAKIFYCGGQSMYSAAAKIAGSTTEEYLDAKELSGSSEYRIYYGYKAENEDFINAILNGTEPLCPIADAAKSMDMAELLLEKHI